MYELGGQGVALDADEAANWYRKAVFESDDPVAHLGLGRLYFSGWSSTPQNLPRSREHLLKAVDNGKPEAGIYLALMSLYGQGAGRDYRIAEQYLLAAASADFPVAYRYLAVAAFKERRYLNGLLHLLKEYRMRFKLRRQDPDHPNLWKLDRVGRNS
jgi:TPR repeat protein